MGQKRNFDALGVISDINNHQTKARETSSMGIYLFCLVTPTHTARTHTLYTAKLILLVLLEAHIDMEHLQNTMSVLTWLICCWFSLTASGCYSTKTVS